MSLTDLWLGARTRWESRNGLDKQRCSTSSLASFTKQLSTLLGSGIQLLDALASLAWPEHSDPLFSRVVPEIGRRVSAGSSLSVCLGAYPRIFPRTYIALVKAAEETGNLVVALDDLALWLDNKDKSQRHVKKALAYPAVIVVVSAVLTIGLFKTVIPGILETVLGLGVALPAPTRLLLLLVTLAESPWTWLLSCALAFAGVSYLRTEVGYERGLTLLSSTPIVAEIIHTTGASRFSLTLSLLLERGVDLVRAVRIATEATGSPLLEGDCQRLTRGLRDGHALGELLIESPLYPRLLVGMAEVGDESGQLSHLLKRAGVILADDAENRIEIFLNLLEPVVLGVLAMAVGFVVIAILMPLSSMTAALG